MSLFSNTANLAEIFGKYNCMEKVLVNMQIGCDKRLYFLFNEVIPERIDGMFVPTESNSSYCVIALDIDWDNEAVVGESFYDLGVQKMNYHYIQPVNDGFMLVASRCFCKDDVGENNAAVLDEHGNIIRQYCFGDGISDVITLADGRIITSYFDEGIFGNYGWKKPLGSSGLVVWDKDGNIIWNADDGIYDCYAMNIDDTERLWYYYYDKFELVCTDLNSKKVYQPNIEGSRMLILPSDGQSVILDKGYLKYDQFAKESLTDDKLSAPETLTTDYEDSSISLFVCRSRASLAAFMDTDRRLFVKHFISA